MKDSAEIRRANRETIRRVLWRGGEHTKQGIALETGLSVATCNTLLNEMEASGEVLGEKRRLQEVGRSTAAYQINEAYQPILCVRFQKARGVTSLEVTVVSALGHVLEEKRWEKSPLTGQDICLAVGEVLERRPETAQILVGTPSIAEHGILRQCDLPELEGEPLGDRLWSAFGRPVHMENDMHYKIYGCYKRCGRPEEVLTLANFPSGVLPGTASIHSGTVLRGHNQFAGMTGFLPWEGWGRERDFENRERAFPRIVASVAAVIVTVNPAAILFTGDLVDGEVLERVREACKTTIPAEYLPEFSYEENVDHYYLEGMYQRALDERGGF